MNTSVELTPEQKVNELTNNPNLPLNDKINYHFSTTAYRLEAVYKQRRSYMIFLYLKVASISSVAGCLIYFFN